jgi:hypothetical protein
VKLEQTGASKVCVVVWSRFLDAVQQEKGRSRIHAATLPSLARRSSTIGAFQSDRGTALRLGRRLGGLRCQLTFNTSRTRGSRRCDVLTIGSAWK